MVMIVFFELIQANSIGGLHWIYIPDILTDVQFGFVASFHYFNGVEIAFASEWMIKYLEPDGLFLFYCIITTLGFVFMFFLSHSPSPTLTLMLARAMSARPSVIYSVCL